MVNNFEIQFDPKACKYYLDDYDVIFVDNQHELRFCRYAKPKAANVSVMPYNIDRNRALCFYDIDHHRWCSKVDDHRYKYWEVIRPDDDIFINILVGIAIDEISGGKTCLSVDDITHRIKSRFGIWYDKYTFEAKNMNGQLNDKERACLYFDEKACGEVKKTINEVYGIKGSKYAQERYKTHMNKSLPPQPKLLQFNGDYTTVVWKDGSHTVVKRTEGEEYDEEKAILFAIVKHLCKDNGCEMSRYFDKFFKNERNINKED